MPGTAIERVGGIVAARHDLLRGEPPRPSAVAIALEGGTDRAPDGPVAGGGLGPHRARRGRRGHVGGADLRPALVEFLAREEPGLEALQSSGGYAAAGAAEFRIWWYHFFYSAVTRALIAEGWIPREAGSRTTYVMPRS